MTGNEPDFSQPYRRTPGEIEVQLKLIKLRFKNLRLSAEQAEKIYAFEQEKETYVEGHYFTFWEESDYEASVFATFLKPAQLKQYEEARRKYISEQEQHVVDQDNDQPELNQLAYHEAILQFYKEQIVPAFFKKPTTLYFSWLQESMAKQQYLREEYHRYLRRSKMAMLTNHFRNYRTFAPNKLKVSLVLHQLNAIWPDVATFIKEMDEPTKAVVKYLAAQMNYLPPALEGVYNSVYSKLSAFHKTSFAEYFGDQGGWHTILRTPSKEEEQEQKALLFLLLKKDGYSG